MWHTATTHCTRGNIHTRAIFHNYHFGHVTFCYVILILLRSYSYWSCSPVLTLS